MKTENELIIDSARDLVGAARRNPASIDIYHSQLLGMRTVVFFVFGEGGLYRELCELLTEMNTPAGPEA